jgi:tRNA G18 (ribose-2'-O)-methylase SpoU
MDEARLIRITDADDPRVEDFRDIRERDLTGRQGRFIAEGTVVLRVLADMHGRPGAVRAERLLILENRLASVAGILADFPADVPVMVAPRAVMDRIAGFPIHRGVLAVAGRPAERSLAELMGSLPSRPLVLAASGIANHDNMGGLFRNAAAFGADAVLLDGACCDPLYRKAIRVSVGAALRVPFVRAGSPIEMMAALGSAGVALWGLSPRGEEKIEEIAPVGGTALLVGTEGEGLPAELLGSIRTARIAQAPGLDSLNLATASGIALHSIASAMGRI